VGYAIFKKMRKGIFMALSDHLQFKMKKRYEPSSVVSIKYKGNDVTFKTDDEGNPVSLFIGTKSRMGKIKGERYTRTLKRDQHGTIIKDHWDLKGKTG
jgi:hypothetical protein